MIPIHQWFPNFGTYPPEFTFTSLAIMGHPFGDPLVAHGGRGGMPAARRRGPVSAACGATGPNASTKGVVS